MRHIGKSYHALIGLLLLTLLISGCQKAPKHTRDDLDERMTFWRRDKIPYGTYVAYKNLDHIFPNAETSINDKSPVGLLNQEGKKAYIIISSEIEPDVSEANAIINLAENGNHVFISTFWLGDALQRALSVRQRTPDYSYYNDFMADTMQLSLYHPFTHDSLSYSYPGSRVYCWIDSLDAQYATILGRDEKGRPDFIRFTYKSGGSILLHSNPLAFTNFFLLHKQNISYYDNAFSYIPVSVSEILWDDYYRYGGKGNSDFSALGYILKNRSLRWAFGLLLLLFAIIYIFESKRRQRLVPVIASLRNNSLDFVKTIGRLYYQRRDNHNLALKMVAHFQDHLRTRYNLPVSLADPGLAERLAYKTGMNVAFLNELIGDMRRFQDSTAVSDEDLMAFNRQLEEFYKLV